MMQAQKDKAAKKTKRKSREPLAEGLRTNRGREWNKMSDRELVAYAKKVLEEKGIRNRKGLRKEDCGLYDVLRKRNLLDEVGFERGNRDWASMSDYEIVEHAKGVLKGKEIRSREGLRKEDCGLYWVLWKRKLLDVVGFEVEKKEMRDWDSMSDRELVVHVKKFVEEKEIRNRRGLRKEDGGLYQTLWKRKLLDEVGFEVEKKEMRDWASMSDEEIVVYAKKFVRKKGVRSRNGLKKEDVGLYYALGKRKLLDKVGFEIKKKEGRERRSWASMSDEELVAYAKKVVEEKGIRNRHGLVKEDGGLYNVLRKRKLLDRVFLPIEKAREREAVRQVYDAMMEFGGQAASR